MTLTATQIADGWKLHDGGECPVDGETVVDFWMRCETPETFLSAPTKARYLVWSDTGDDFDIIAYKEQSHADGE